jgi:hypothetical protein
VFSKLLTLFQCKMRTASLSEFEMFCFLYTFLEVAWFFLIKLLSFCCSLRLSDCMASENDGEARF